MIPYLLAALGGYLIGDSIGEDIEKFSVGGNLYRTKEGSIVSWNTKKLKFVKDSEKYNTSWGRLGNAIGEFDIKDNNKFWYGTLYELDDFDRKYWSGVKLKPDEMLFRYETYTTKVTNIRPVVKINIDKGIIYFLKDLYADDDKNLVFETRGVKLKFLQLHEKIMQDIKGYLPYPLEKMADGGTFKSNLRDVYDDLRYRVSGIRFNEETKDYIYCDVRDWGNWEHDYDDYERDEEDFEDDDSMILSRDSAKRMNEIIKELSSKYPDIKIEWSTSEKSYIDFQISRKSQSKEEKMADMKIFVEKLMMKRGGMTMADGGGVPKYKIKHNSYGWIVSYSDWGKPIKAFNTEEEAKRFMEDIEKKQEWIAVFLNNQDNTKEWDRDNEYKKISVFAKNEEEAVKEAIAMMPKLFTKISKGENGYGWFLERVYLRQ